MRAFWMICAAMSAVLYVGAAWMVAENWSRIGASLEPVTWFSNPALVLFLAAIYAALQSILQIGREALDE